MNVYKKDHFNRHPNVIPAYAGIYGKEFLFLIEVP